MKKIVTYVLACTVCVLAHAQSDSTLLQEATVVESRYVHLSSFQFKRVHDSVSKLITPALTAAEWLNTENSVHVRQYSPGSVASYSTRGANSAQNAILWSGFNINSAGTGLTDVSLVPVDLFNMSMLRGGSAANFGTGAIGSAVNLGTNQMQKGWQIDFSQQVASFETFKTLAKVIYKSPRFESQTSFYNDQSKNNFPYVNQWRLPEREETRKHAEYNQWHILQKLGFALNQANRIEAEGWFNKAERNSPNNVIASPGTAVLTDKNFRGKAGWFYSKDQTKLDVQYAYLHEWQSFEDPNIIDVNGRLLDTNITVSHLAQVNHQWDFLHSFSWQNGLLVRYDKASGSNRKGSQNTASLQSGINYDSRILEAQVVLRAEVWDGEFLPISPFAAVRYTFHNHFYISANGGYVYRIPTLNDRFWIPGGNSDLQPEFGWTGEASIGTIMPLLRGQLLGSVTGYYSLLNDYVQWVPIGVYWVPQNVKQVEIRGIDINAEYSITKGRWYGKVDVGGSYNSSIIQKSHLEGDESVGQQLVYQPRVKWSSGATMGYANWYFKVIHRYVGEVYTLYTSSNNTLVSYHLLDVSLSKAFSLKRLLFTLIAAANNITDTQYQNISYFPMPGINYSLTLKLSI